MESLTLFTARPIESVLQSIEKFRLMFTLESFRQCIQDHFYSIAGIPGWACQPAQTRGPCN